MDNDCPQDDGCHDNDPTVRRAGLVEARVAIFRINAYAWRKAYDQAVNAWMAFATECLHLQLG